MREILARRISLVTWTAGLAVIALITAFAVVGLVGALRLVYIYFPGAYGVDGLVAIGVATVLAAALVLVTTWVAHRRPPIIGLLCGMTILVVLRLVVMVLIDAPLHNDPLFQNDLALGVLKGQCCFSHRPMGYPIALAGAYAIFGPQIAVAEVLNLAFAVATGWFVYDTARRVWDETVGAAALATFAVIPSQILLIPVPLTETMYAMLISGSVWAVVAFRARPLIAAAGSAALLALSQYVRSTSVAFLPALLVVPLLDGAIWRRVAQRAVASVAVFLLVLLPVVQFNLQAHGELSISTSAYAGWTLYVGTNQKFDGQWNPEDAARMQAFPGDTIWEKSEVAGREGMARIASDPAGFAALVVRKFAVQWANEDYGANYAIGPGFAGNVRPSLHLLSLLVYIGLLLLALLGLWLERQRRPPALVLALLILLAVVVIHVFAEVTGRYHAYVIPLLCIIAGVGWTWILGMRSTERHHVLEA
jgi:4-amino-4-deoxy-L-arabinose transferase-like glycosyltransferase